MKTHEPYVKLLGTMDHRREAWKTSRPMFDEKNLNFDKVEEMDLSLNSMLVYTIEMRSSVIMRDLIFSIRPLEGWALSTRSMPISLDTVRLSGEFEDNNFEYGKIERMFSLLSNGNSRDQARGVLPLSVSSTYTFTIDFRALIGLCKALEEIDPVLFTMYGIQLLGETGNLEAYRTTTVKSSLPYNIINDCDRINGVEEAGSMMIGHYEMKMALASQFLRQHYSKIKIGLWNKVKEKGYYNLGMDQNSMVDVTFCIDRISYRRLIAMRSHWVIDHSLDMWGKIVGDYIDGMTSAEFWEFTPAGGGKDDPYWADCYNRITLDDPGIPCPIMTEWPQAIEERRKETGGNPVLDKYQELFDDGFIKDNPDNVHRKLYLENIEKNGGSNDGVSLTGVKK